MTSCWTGPAAYVADYVAGPTVVDRGDRLTKLFLAPSPTRVDQATRIMAGSTRYNVGTGTRPVNIQTLALMFLHPDIRTRRFTVNTHDACADRRQGKLNVSKGARMSKMLYGCALTVAAALGGAGCANAQTAQAQNAQNAQPITVATADQNEVVATVGDRKFTLKEVEAKWQEDDPAERAKVTQLLYQHRRQSIDQLIGSYFIEEAAKKAGVPTEKYLEAEMTKRRGTVTDAEIQKVYGENKDRVGAQTVEQLRGSITQFIERNRDAQNLAILVDELRKSGPAVKVSLDPPRYTVALAAHDPSRGPVDAPITIVEFSEYQCPFCGRVTPTLKALEQKYAGKVRIVFKDFPLQNHAQAPKAAEAAHCAGDQGKYWELHDQMFSNQQQLQIADLRKYAGAVGLDQTRFDRCLESGTHAANVQADVDLGSQIGVQSTPTLYINGRVVTGAQPASVFEAIIDEELALQAGKQM